ncbi:soma ferritin [Anopheles arabiensis]|uniref:Ferritin n=5 Tax=gambiae species complex TaxID=44542 RepID=A0ND34_ANOGA|nr:ferritin light chain [Anopheles gambiae]XP_040154620.1 soma ferritin [Anopheles arabiensis]XP_040229088.1 soma ferritin [Anopheles coluzzii]XP_041760910.1 soma ferritin [Anopheles merus]EAU77119.3 AGAP002464-PA [Anopheles gambiae str. PEST]ABR88146.1 ferritin light chain-like protein precursor [Anopheles gambiae]
MMAKMNVVFVLGFVLVASAFATDLSANDCEINVEECSPTYSSFLSRSGKTVENDLKQYTSQLVDKSFHFLMMSSAFNKHSLDRPGFEKLYRKISDKAWADAIELIKYQSRRGSFGHLVQPSKGENYGKVLDVQELSSLQFALDYEKQMAKEAHAIHRKISHAHSKAGSNGSDDVYHYDPDAAHYLDENIIEYQSGVVRDLAGYVHNLKHFTSAKHAANDLGNHVFDEFLAKVE